MKIDIKANDHIQIKTRNSTFDVFTLKDGSLQVLSEAHRPLKARDRGGKQNIDMVRSIIIQEIPEGSEGYE